MKRKPGFRIGPVKRELKERMSELFGLLKIMHEYDAPTLNQEAFCAAAKKAGCRLTKRGEMLAKRYKPTKRAYRKTPGIV